MHHPEIQPDILRDLEDSIYLKTGVTLLLNLFPVLVRLYCRFQTYQSQLRGEQ